MKNIKMYYNSIKNKIKSIKTKDVLKVFGIGCLMTLGLYVGSIIYGVLGAGFGLALGYVCGRLLTSKLITV